MVSENAIRAFSEIMRQNNNKNQFAYIFKSRTKKFAQKHKKLHRTTVYRQFENAVKKAGLEGKGYTVHSLRKVYARNLFAKTNSITAVQRDMKHDNIATTLMYLVDIN